MLLQFISTNMITIINFLSEPILIRALISGFSLALISGPLGCLIYWQRMAYFGDALAHATLLGVVLGLLLNINLLISITFIAILFSLILWNLRNKITGDSSLSILAQAFLAISLTIVAFMKDIRVDISEYMFGDILLIDNHDIIIIITACLLIGIWLYILWNKILLIIINKDLAYTYNIKVNLVELQFTLIVAIFTAISIKFIGILLIGALLIIPAACSRFMCLRPKTMAMVASIIAILSIIFGLINSFYFDIASGPAIISTSIVMFITCLIVKSIKA